MFLVIVSGFAYGIGDHRSQDRLLSIVGIELGYEPGGHG
jgi:hypothetical protein